MKDKNIEELDKLIEESAKIAGVELVDDIGSYRTTMSIGTYKVGDIHISGSRIFKVTSIIRTEGKSEEYSLLEENTELLWKVE